MKRIIGGIVFLIGFLFLLYAGTAVDVPTGTMHDVVFWSVCGVILCAGSLVLINWEQM